MYTVTDRQTDIMMPIANLLKTKDKNDYWRKLTCRKQVSVLVSSDTSTE